VENTDQRPGLIPPSPYVIIYPSYDPPFKLHHVTRLMVIVKRTVPYPKNAKKITKR
jgi:hypothetical protein